MLLRSRSSLLCLAVLLGLVDPLPAQTPDPPPAGLSTLQFAGRGRIEGVRDGDRLQGRFMIFGIDGADEPVFGKDVSLFDDACVARSGRRVGCAHFVAVLDAVVLEFSDTHDATFIGHQVIRMAGSETVKIWFDPSPDGTRDFEDLASFERGQVVAAYDVREYVTLDPVNQVIFSRNNLVLASSQSFTYAGVTADFAEFAPRLAGVWQGRLPVPDPLPDPIPSERPPFDGGGAGFFLLRFPISGLLQAVASP